MNLTVSFLPTKNDYVEFVSCSAYMNVTKRKKAITLILGIFLILIGFIFKFLSWIGNGEFGLIIAAGVFICLYFLLFYPVFIRTKALQYFERHKEKMNSVSYIFKEDSFSILSDRYQVHDAPYSMIFKTVNNEKIFLLLMGESEIRYIPRRALNDTEAIQLKNKLQAIQKSRS